MITKKRFLFLIFLIGLIPSFAAAEGSAACDLKIRPLLDQLTQSDFPIEKYFPGQKVSAGVINRSSKAFITWRARTAPHIPDEAFNWHYYTEKQKLEAAGFPELKQVKANPRSATHAVQKLSPDCKSMVESFYRNHHTVTAFEITPPWKQMSQAIEKHGSPEAMLRELGISPTLTRQKAHRLWNDPTYTGKYFIDSSGTLYFLSTEELALIEKATGISEVHHRTVLPLLFPSYKGGMLPIIDYGYVGMNLLFKPKPEDQKNKFIVSHIFRGEKKDDFPLIEYFRKYQDVPASPAFEVKR